jgi:hypothetical protein
MKGWDWTLSKGQRQSLQAELAQTRDATLYRRIWALLEVDQGRSVAEVARLSSATVMKRFATTGGLFVTMKICSVENDEPAKA